MWYLWDKRETHGKKTLASKNLPSKHDYVVNQEFDGKDCTIFIGKGEWMSVEITHYAILAARDEALDLGLCNA